MKEIFNRYDIVLSDEEEKKLNFYYELLVEWNKKINLTSIIEYEDVIWKHFLDSSLIMKSDLWKEEKRVSVLDVGTGAGFPGMVLAILNPDRKFVLMDSLNKRVDFLNVVIEKLQVKNVTAHFGRAENLARKELFRNQFDFVVSRAVAELPVLMEYCIPFVKENGYFVSYKGKKQREEIEKSENAFKKLTCFLENVEKYQLKDREDRYLLFIKNEQKTNEKYPRREGKPKKKPL